MGIVDDIRKILQVKLKPRQDSYSDQFSRVVLLKVMLFGAFITGMSWYSDKINCIILQSGGKPIVEPGFVQQSCWINGFYVYEEIRDHKNNLGYYGLPREINMDGKYPESQAFCDTDGPTGNSKNKGCVPMKKTFFMQFQYMTFFLTALACLYYSPYMLFKFVNTDIASLKDSIKDGEKAEIIAKNYFNHNINSTAKLKSRVMGNFVVKLLYIAANVAAFILTNQVLNGRFQSYGVEWIKWSNLNNSIAFDYMGARGFPKPGEYMLPSFALCEIYETAEDKINLVVNKYKFICELSQHVLYQYVLMLIWWAMIAGIVTSLVGFFVQIYDYIMVSATVRKRVPRARSSHFTLRELEYLEFIYNKNMPLFGNLLKALGAGADEEMENFE